MPKIVDWDARRDEILSATWRVIARDGISGATIRAIAREANCSRGILAHYFDDKADILGSALVMSHRRVVARAMPSRAITRQVADRISSLRASQSTIFGMITLHLIIRPVFLPDVRLISGIRVPQRLGRASGGSRAARQLQRTPA